MCMTYLVVLPDLANEVAERLIDVDSLLRGGLNEFAAEVLREIATLCIRVSSNSCVKPSSEQVRDIPFMPT